MAVEEDAQMFRMKWEEDFKGHSPLAHRGDVAAPNHRGPPGLGWWPLQAVLMLLKIMDGSAIRSKILYRDLRRREGTPPEDREPGVTNARKRPRARAGRGRTL